MRVLVYLTPLCWSVKSFDKCLNLFFFVLEFVSSLLHCGLRKLSDIALENFLVAWHSCIVIISYMYKPISISWKCIFSSEYKTIVNSRHIIHFVIHINMSNSKKIRDQYDFQIAHHSFMRLVSGTVGRGFGRDTEEVCWWGLPPFLWYALDLCSSSSLCSVPYRLKTNLLQLLLHVK